MGIFGRQDEKESRYPAFGFYSQDAAALFGSYIYKTEQGKEIEVTAVFNDVQNGQRAYRWADVVLRGRVTELVRWGKTPTRFDKAGMTRMGLKVKAA